LAFHQSIWPSDVSTRLPFRLSRSRQVAFAAACTERVLPACDEFFLQKHKHQAELLRGALNEIWISIASVQKASGLRDLLLRCRASIPSTTESESPLSLAAESAAIGLVHTLEASIHSMPSPVGLASRYALEAIRAFPEVRIAVENGIYLAPWAGRLHHTLADRQRIERQLRQEVTLDRDVVAEVERQRRDLAELQGAPLQGSLGHFEAFAGLREPLEEDSVERLRDRARGEAPLDLFRALAQLGSDQTRARSSTQSLTRVGEPREGNRLRNPQARDLSSGKPLSLSRQALPRIRTRTEPVGVTEASLLGLARVASRILWAVDDPIAQGVRDAAVLRSPNDAGDANYIVAGSGGRLIDPQIVEAMTILGEDKVIVARGTGRPEMIVMDEAVGALAGAALGISSEPPASCQDTLKRNGVAYGFEASAAPTRIPSEGAWLGSGVGTGFSLMCIHAPKGNAFDEQAWHSEVEWWLSLCLRQAHRVAFAAICAERVVPAYELLTQGIHWERNNAPRTALDEVWAQVIEPDGDINRLQALLIQCEAAIRLPPSNSASYLAAAAESAIICVAHSVKACIDRTARSAALASQYAREAVAGYPETRIGLERRRSRASRQRNIGQAAKEQRLEREPNDALATDPLIVAEWELQRRDLEALEQQGQLDKQFVAGLRSRAKKEAPVDAFRSLGALDGP
jgi:uncharacterized protein YjaG (DUF416 family)